MNEDDFNKKVEIIASAVDSLREYIQDEDLHCYGLLIIENKDGRYAVSNFAI